jgi:Holliday junction resolvasome RuvABC endonuclease subunit
MVKEGSRRFLGIDPSPRKTGLALVQGDLCQVLLVKPNNLRGGERLKYQVDCLREFLRRVGPVSGACVEGPSLESGGREDDMGQMRGALLYVLADAEIPTRLIPPTSLKLFATGNGGASKERMIEAAVKKWPDVDFYIDDLADAAWLARFCLTLNEDTLVSSHELRAIRGISSETKNRTQKHSDLNI